MLYISLSLIIGLLIGFMNVIPKKWLRYNDHFTLFGMLLLLFIMGISLGMNDHVLKNLRELGVASLLFTVFTVIFSILVVYLLAKLTLKEKKE